jgi:hypothetical protein
MRARLPTAPPIADQAALEIFIKEDYYDRHRRIRRLPERYDAMMHAAQRHSPVSCH